MEESCGTRLSNPSTGWSGEWTLTLTDAWFLESRDVRQTGRATARWLGDAFIELEAEMEGEHVWHFVLGRSDANEQLVALYHDPRPTSRLFTMTFDGDGWTLRREDPDFHQRFVAQVGADSIDGHWDASGGSRRIVAQGLRPDLRADRLVGSDLDKAPRAARGVTGSWRHRWGGHGREDRDLDGSGRRR